MVVELKTRQRGSVQILELAGRFDAYATPPIVAWLEQVSQTTGIKIVVNMAEVKFIDSTGLATLVQGMKHARQQGGDLYLANLQIPVRVIFELTRLDKAIAIFESEDKALANFDSSDSSDSSDKGNYDPKH